MTEPHGHGASLAEAFETFMSPEVGVWDGPMSEVASALLKIAGVENSDQHYVYEDAALVAEKLFKAKLDERWTTPAGEVRTLARFVDGSTALIELYCAADGEMRGSAITL